MLTFFTPIRVLAWSALLSVAAAVLPAAEPANPKATPQARRVLEYFHELSGRREGRRMLSGQFSDFGNGANLRIMVRIHEQTGRWPALIGVDYADFGRGSLTTKVPNQVAMEYWKQGGLVTVMAHMYNPANPKGGGLRDKGVNLADLLADGTETHSRWMQQLDLMAGGLQELRSAGVVVLWRPFHEMNGGWFFAFLQGRLDGADAAQRTPLQHPKHLTPQPGGISVGGASAGSELAGSL